MGHQSQNGEKLNFRRNGPYSLGGSPQRKYHFSALLFARCRNPIGHRRFRQMRADEAKVPSLADQPEKVLLVSRHPD